MNSTTRARMEARSSANHRLYALTVGAAVLGVVGTGVFSYAAALTYTGKTSVAAADQQTSSNPGAFVDPNASGGETPFGAQAPNTGGQVTPTAPRVRHSNRNAGVSTGGS